VTEQPTSCPAAKGQEPSGNCAERKNCRPRRQASLDTSLPATLSRACSTQQVGSTRLGEPGRYPQPPSSFCALRNLGRQTLSTKPADGLCPGGKAMTPPRAPEELSGAKTSSLPGITFTRFDWTCTLLQLVPALHRRNSGTSQSRMPLFTPPIAACRVCPPDIAEGYLPCRGSRVD
jgi:hypothetical protein